MYVHAWAYRCFELCKYHHSRRGGKRIQRALCSRFLSSTFELYLSPVGKNYQSIVRLRFYLRFECCYHGEKIVSKFDGFVIGGKVVQVRLFFKRWGGKRRGFGKLVRVFSINSSSSTKISTKMKISSHMCHISFEPKNYSKSIQLILIIWFLSSYNNNLTL